MISINQSISTKAVNLFLIYKRIEHPFLPFCHSILKMSNIHHWNSIIKQGHVSQKASIKFEAKSLKKTTNPNYRPRLLHIFSQI